ncbi:uncharacterized protein LOC120016163 isoform X2 [Tripterygium wilfordii]|uniref:uncharacterized protein LOC120016163 isoform X2 n=1 Tax=Tripterygium wilfordii TaxID=458696 RepID=UPI0018F82DC1|nr:uncharacterized protein LOC120016163 isoform X2 [Tripterygium wilfordii]
MDHQWRPRQVLGTICPVCAVSHFPFCAPPPHPHPPGPLPYQPDPRMFPPQHDHYRPPFDPYNAPVGMDRNLNSMYNYGGSNGYPDEFDRSYKRPRVGESGSGSLMNENHLNYQNQAGFSLEDERRLKLIREHGSASGGGDPEFDVNCARGDVGPIPPRNGQYLGREEAYGQQLYSIEDGFNREEHLQSRHALLERSYETAASRDSQHIQPHYFHRNNWQDYDSQMQMPSYVGGPSIGNHNMAAITQYSSPNITELRGRLPPLPTQRPPPPPPPPPPALVPTSWVFDGQPPLPASPPPPIPPVDLPAHPSSEFKAYSSSPNKSFPLFPVTFTSSPMAHSSYPPVPNASTGAVVEEFQEFNKAPLKQLSPAKPKVIDASHLFKLPYRATRPDHFVVILRGLPGSGKSYVAKMMRDLEVENGGTAPRIHSMDDYFMTEVEKVEDGDASKSSTSIRGKKATTVKKVMEYCYEPEMEEAYRASMLKAFKKTLEEGIFMFVIVDDRNLRVADFAQFWAIAKRLGYEVYIAEATYKDPAGCAARNVHGFTLDDIQKMAAQWEEAPSLYVQLDIKVDMDMEDGNSDNDPSGPQEKRSKKATLPYTGVDVPDGSGRRWDAEGDQRTQKVKDLGRSKWSNDLDEDGAEGSESAKHNLNALPGPIKSYSKHQKSVRWSDQAGNTGFSIGAAKQASVPSLVIGPGVGYNLKSNPFPEDIPPLGHSTGKSKKQSIFQERLREEQESFRSVFDRRRHRIGGLDLEE